MHRDIVKKLKQVGGRLMTNTNIYGDIAERTKGDIYIGVVGPVRTGKSTFIKRVMEQLVLPNMTGGYDKKRALDEMPQSAGGKTVMTTEPKFIPDEAVDVKIGDSASFRMRLIDCVGYIVPGAIGHIEDGEVRMVTTPWSDVPISFEDAAKIGTDKVIREHSTIGLVVTTDGTIGDLPRDSYVQAEKQVIDELRAINKPFVVVLNSADPTNAESVKLAYELEQKYSVPVALVNCQMLTENDVSRILEMVLFEFPIKELRFTMPSWLDVLPSDHPLSQKINDAIVNTARPLRKVGEIKEAFGNIADEVMNATISEISLGDGSAHINVSLADGLFYETLSELTGFDIADEKGLARTLSELSDIKRKYEKVSSALESVETTGYGVVAPTIDDLKLEEPEIVKQAGGYGVKLKASAPSIHMIKANIETEVSPMVGTAQQSEDLVRFLLDEFEEDPKKIWESNMFGKKLHDLVGEGLNTKLSHMPEEVQGKLSRTLGRIINEGSGGLICILL